MINSPLQLNVQSIPFTYYIKVMMIIITIENCGHNALTLQILYTIKDPLGGNLTKCLRWTSTVALRIQMQVTNTNVIFFCTLISCTGAMPTDTNVIVKSDFFFFFFKNTRAHSCVSVERHNCNLRNILHSYLEYIRKYSPSLNRNLCTTSFLYSFLKAVVMIQASHV